MPRTIHPMPRIIMPTEALLLMVLVSENPYYLAAAGGVLLGVATTLNYALRGRVTGMSGIIYGVLTLHRQDLHEKLSIIGGMVVASGVFFDAFGYGSFNNFTPFGPANSIASQTSYIGYAVAGLLVGFGTKLSNGCTSGHGLCGLPRLSIRSLVAVSVFLTTAIGISTVRYYCTLGALSDEALNPIWEYNHLVSANVCVAIGLVLPLLGACVKSRVDEKATVRDIVVDHLVTFLVGAIFGCGLLVAGMVRRSNIIGFLGLGENWNPSLLFVLGCGVLINLLTFNYMLRVKKVSYFGRHLFNPENKLVDWKLMLGAACFGLGWGIGGLCPGPAIMQLSVYTVPIHVIWLGCMLAGMLLSRKLEHYLHEEEEKKKHEAKAKEEEEAKAHHKHHHKHPHRAQHHHDGSLVLIQPQESLEFIPVVDLIKQESDDTLRVTAAQSLQKSTLVDSNSLLESPKKSK